MSTTTSSPAANAGETIAGRAPLPLRQRRWHVGTLGYGIAGLAILFAFLLLGDFAWNMKDRAIGPICQIMLRDFRAPVWLVGLLIGSIPAAIGLLLGPVIGVLSDRHRGRMGRRIPFILAAVPFITIAMLGLAVTPRLGIWLHRLLGSHGISLSACQVGVFAFFWSALDIAAVVANSLYGALVNDVVPQPVIGRFFAAFRIIGLGAGVLFFAGLMDKVEAHLPAMLAALGVLYGVCFVVMCLCVKEGQYPPAPPKVKIKTPIELLKPVATYLVECYGNPFFLWFFLITTLGGLTLAPVNTFQIYHSRSVHLSDHLYGQCIAISYAISMVLAYPIGSLADRYHPLRVGLASMALYGAATGLGFCFATNARLFYIALLLHTVISGAHITATASIAQRLLPRNKFAEICAAGGVIGAIVGMFVAPSLGIFIQLMHQNYRYVFLLAAILAGLTCISYLFMIRQYHRHGGDAEFVPPQ